MARLTLHSEDITKSLASLAKRVADALEWVALHPRGVDLKLPDEFWQHYGGNWILGANCDSPQRLIQPKCLVRAVPAERAEAEILLAVLAKKEKGRARPKARRSR